MARSRKSSSSGADAEEHGAPTRRQRIVLEAGRLFAEKGYHGVSMREIASAADVQLSLIVYHFSTKENLYRSVFDHFHTIFEERLELLDRVEASSAPDALRRIIEAFVLPVQKARETEEGRIYSQLILREASDPEQETRGIVRDYYDPMATRFIAALKLALPEKDVDGLAWGYLFSVSALVMSHFDARMQRLSNSDMGEAHEKEKNEFLIRFICGGLKGI
ncbi:TetR family transcriptional regulator [Breoghania corrubedonensis]|uniref:TetR family transcriptional regulator n=1 Tax=Breoghania corrubedonensis TaxID=665038 RepID=A0A2T5V6U5_9HYPH|nr:TetR/AcrR family transcriptional regulator [Breoghania corrubedonensis]PTW59460.1 TetR family transcriptional regulator [Breoghania corrubedonensis]